MRSFQIGKNDCDKRLDKFVTQNAPKLPQSLMYKYLRTKRIKVNGKKKEISYRLCLGDTVEMYIDDEMFSENEEVYDFLHAGRDLSIVYEDENILLLDKKAGLLSHPEKGEYVDTLITRVKRYLYEKGEYDPSKENSFAPALANRIDRNTGGIVIAAKTAESLRILCEKIKNREIDKRYLCVTVGSPKVDEGILDLYMTKDEKKNQVKVYSKQVPGSKEMKTGYRVLKKRNGLSLVDVKLYTGRTHQIRASFAYIGCPLLGDGKYGNEHVNKMYGGYKKQFLYSYSLTFDFKTDAGVLNYLAGKSFECHNIWFVDEFENLKAL